MVDKNAAKLALVVAGAVVLLLLAGQVMRLLSRLVLWGTIPVVAVLLGYAVYELRSGWTAAGEAESPDRATGVGTDREAPVETVREEYAEGDISEAELDRELEDLMDEELETERN